jgi:hypothetical protein
MEVVMIIAEPSLEQVLKKLSTLRSEELELVEKQLASTKKNNKASSSPGTLLEDEMFLIPFEEYLALSEDECDEVQMQAYEKYRSWIYDELEKRGAQWMLVCGGKIIESSPTLDDYPSDEKMYALGKQLGYAPLVFIANPVIEESYWVVLPKNDFYPSLSITIGSADWDEAELQEKGIAMNADFDTGAASLWFDYNQLLAENLIKRQRFKRTHPGYHFGRQYNCYALPIQVAMVDEAGRTVSTIVSVLCVLNWQQSPLCIVNPSRKALVGRKLLLGLPIRIELSGQKRSTKIFIEDSI